MSKTPRLWRTAVLPCFLFVSASAEAATISIAWDRNPESNLAGYIVSFGTAAGQYSQTVNVGLSTTWSLEVGDARTYYFRVQASVAGAFNNTQVVRVTVAPSTSRPMMVVDTPTANAGVSGAFTIGGWALDLASQTGSGVDTVHVWAYPASGAAAILVGNSPIGVPRPDVGGVFGARFSASGYNVSARLPAGNYTLAVFAHSAVANAFNNTLLVPITVR